MATSMSGNPKLAFLAAFYRIMASMYRQMADLDEEECIQVIWILNSYLVADYYLLIVLVGKNIY